MAGAGFGSARHCRARKRRFEMNIEYLLGGVVCAALVVYLLYALLNAEDF